MSALAKRAVWQRTRHFSTTVSTEVDVDIDPDDLHDEGWHHDSECDTHCKHTSGFLRPLVLDWVSYADAIGSLHRQAHPSQHADPAMCREEPCRSLSYAQLRGEVRTP